MNRWVSEGRSPHEVGLIMRDEFGPHMNGRRFREAEKVLDRALDILKKEAPVQKPKDLKKYLRKTEETQYLILPIRQAGSLYGGQTNAFEKAIERVVERIGKVEDLKKRNWAFHLIIPAWRFDPEHRENKHALTMKDYLARHFDYGATVIVFNTGATSKELSESLTEGVWGEDAVNAYRAFLNPGRSRP